MTLGSLFDGSGAFPFAGLLCGIEPMWASEIEKFPIQVTSKRFPHMKHLGDIRNIDGGKIEPVDVITFGSPCQNMSVAGNREGLAGSESGLFYEAIRVIREMKEATNGRYPTFAVWENVPGSLTSRRGEDFRQVLQEFVKLCGGRVDVPRPEKWRRGGAVMGDDYSVAWRVLAADGWGVPQKRRRVFLVADFGGQRAPKILFEREGLSRDFAEIKSAWGRIDTDCEVGVDKTGEFIGRKIIAIENHPSDGLIRKMGGDVCQALTAQMGTGGGNVPLVAENVTFFDRAMFNQGTNAKYSPVAETDGKTTTVVAKGPGAVAYSMNTRWYRFPVTEEKTITMEAADYKTPLNVIEKSDAESPEKEGVWIIRRLTPRECGRLQGMPDWWCLDVAHGDAPEYKMWGNGIALPCALYIMEGIAGRPVMSINETMEAET